MPYIISPKLVKFLEARRFFRVEDCWQGAHWVKHEVTETGTYDIDLYLRGQMDKTGIPSRCQIQLRDSARRAAIKVTGRYKWVSMFDDIVDMAFTLGMLTKKVEQGCNYKIIANQYLSIYDDAHHT